jgi:hypothetical protein
MLLSSAASTVCYRSQAMADQGPSVPSPSGPTSQPSTATYTSFFSYLPRAVRSRIPVLPSLRRSYSAPNVKELASVDKRVVSLASREGIQQLHGLRARQSRLVSEGTMVSASGSEGLGGTWTSIGTETASGVDWFTAETGLMLVNRAYSQASRNGEMINASAVRSQHIHGLVYLLRALPHDLNSVEVRQLQNALPDELQADWRLPAPRQARGNALSRSITFVMLQCAIFLSFLLPILMRLSDRCLQYEREHHVIQKLLANSGQALESVGERGLDLKDTIMRFGHGRVGGALFGGVTWVAEGIVQGISEGAGRSAVIVGSAVVLRSDKSRR